MIDKSVSFEFCGSVFLICLDAAFLEDFLVDGSTSAHLFALNTLLLLFGQGNCRLVLKNGHLVGSGDLGQSLRLHYVAAKELIDLLVAIDALRCTCFTCLRANKHFVRESVKQVRQVSLLLAHGLDPREKSRLGVVVRVEHHLKAKQNQEGQNDARRYIVVVKLVPLGDLEQKGHPRDELPHQQVQYPVDSREVGDDEDQSEKGVQLNVTSRRRCNENFRTI